MVHMPAAINGILLIKHHNNVHTIIHMRKIVARRVDVGGGWQCDIVYNDVPTSVPENSSLYTI